jgi:hypothetical protein
MERFEGAIKPSSVEKAAFDQYLYANRITEIPSSMKKRFEYDANGNCIYTGYAPTGLEEGTNGWLLWKLTYDVNNRCTEINIAGGDDALCNWTQRTTYTYD